jgi:NAD+ diphosphatase
MRPGFTGAGLDRADRFRLDEVRLAELAISLEARLLRLSGLDPDLDEEGRLGWDEMAGAEELIFLGLREGIPLFAPLIRAEPGQRAWSVFALLNRMAAEDTAVWGTARSLIEWHNRHLFCGACGAPARPFRGGWGRRCTGCGLEHFPRVDPVVIMLAEHEGRVLLGRQPQYPAGRYSALAGFVEPGESIEEAVARELGEEAGIEVGARWETWGSVPRAAAFRHRPYFAEALGGRLNSSPALAGEGDRTKCGGGLFGLSKAPPSCFAWSPPGEIAGRN